eukprot:scaffold135095_cov48-Cyclotella_meneghiniana.AAC.1
MTFRIGVRRGPCRLNQSRLSGTRRRSYNRYWSIEIGGVLMVDDEQRGRHDEDGTDDEEEAP